MTRGKPGSGVVKGAKKQCTHLSMTKIQKTVFFTHLDGTRDIAGGFSLWQCTGCLRELTDLSQTPKH